MTVQSVPPTATGAPSGIADWVRKAANAINATIKDVLGLTERVSDAEDGITALEADVGELDGDMTALQLFLEPPLAVEAVELGCREVTASTAYGGDDFLIAADATGGAVTLTLPALVQGRFLSAKKLDASANAVTVQGAANIDGGANLALATQFESALFIGGVSRWHRLS